MYYIYIDIHTQNLLIKSSQDQNEYKHILQFHKQSANLSLKKSPRMEGSNFPAVLKSHGINPYPPKKRTKDTFAVVTIGNVCQEGVIPAALWLWATQGFTSCHF